MKHNMVPLISISALPVSAGLETGDSDETSTLKVRLHRVKANVKAIFSLLFVAAQCEH